MVQLAPENLGAVVNRLRRAQGQIGGILKMIEDGRNCDEIVMQLAAVSKAVDRAGFSTISIGLRQCMEQPDPDPLDQAKMEKLFLGLA